MRRFVLAVAMLATAAGGFAWSSAAGAGAPGGNNEVVVVPFMYSTTPLHVPHGEPLAFTNLDPISGEGHSLTHAVAKGAELFKSPINPPGTTAPVAGVEKLEKGSYSFTCRVHPFMAGTLVID